jgi:L-histidine Nalpha-methyltransferase
MTARPVTLDVRLDTTEMRATLERDAREGLLSSPKTLPPVWFYDEVGSELFDQITRLPEYYPTRAERALLEAYARDVADATEAATLVELGAGTCTKTRILLDAFTATGTLRRYVAVDVAETTLVAATEQLAQEYPGLDVTATIADFHHLSGLFEGEGRVLVAFLGGTIGNLEPAERARFLVGLDAELDHADAFLLGADLVKDRGRLLAAYDDESGVTAAFNRNVLRVLNRELGADFDVGAFQHVVRFDEDHQWIEMRLRATSAQKVVVPGLGIELTFEEGEELRTEISAKFTADGIHDELDRGGFVVDRQFGAADGEFLLTLSHPYC